MKNKSQFFLQFVIILIAAQLLLPLVSAAQQRESALPTGFEQICPKAGGIAGCITRIYIFSLGFGALVALLMLVTAGYRYMTAGGNAEQVQSAKDTFTSTFTGLIIIFIAFILLYLINPDLVQFRPLPLPPFPPIK